MLDDEVIDKVIERLTRRIEKANTYILKEIGRSIKEIGTINPTKANQLVQMLKYGGNYEKIIKEISKYTRLNVKDIQEIFEEVAKNDYRFAKQFYDYRGKNYIPYKYNYALQNQVNALANITAQEYLNLTNTTALGFGMPLKNGSIKFKGLKETYYDLLDEAVLSVQQGKETFENAMYRQLKDIAESGIKVIYPTTYIDKDGIERHYVRRLDSAVRMNMKSSLRSLHNEMQKQLGKEFNSDGVEISVHENPAEDHQDAQGKQFSNEEYKKLQETGSATTYDKKHIDMHIKNHFRPISEWNCYHYIFSIVLGVNKPQYSNKQLQEIKERNEKGFDFEGKHYTMYEGTQLQRRIETEIRKQKDVQIGAKASGNEQLMQESQQKIRLLGSKYNDLNKASGLRPKIERLKVDGYKKATNSELNILNSENEKTVKINNVIEKNKNYNVNWDYVKSKEYHIKFNNITNNDALNENIYNESIKILKHRDGTNGEDLAYFNYQSNQLIGKQTNMKTPSNVIPTPIMKSALNKNNKIISLHNHPLSNPPSDYDLNSAFINNYHLGITIGHNGNIIVYKIGNNFKKIDNSLYEMTVAKFKKMRYNEYEAQIMALKSFQKENDFDIKVI